jgi:ribose 5-phosphate isomerase A
MSDADDLKRQVGEAAAALVENGMVVGIGTGSTANHVIDSLGERVRQGLDFVGIPTSRRSEERARALGIRIVGFDTHDRIDLTIDGADEIARGTLHLVKGLGGALLREKIVEVAGFGWESTARQLGLLGARVTPRQDRNGSLFVTDGGNMILDCAFAPIADPAALEAEIAAIVGVFESGLFVGRAALALVAGRDGVVRIEPG